MRFNSSVLETSASLPPTSSYCGDLPLSVSLSRVLPHSLSPCVPPHLLSSRRLRRRTPYASLEKRQKRESRKGKQKSALFPFSLLLSMGLYLKCMSGCRRSRSVAPDHKSRRRGQEEARGGESDSSLSRRDNEALPLAPKNMHMFSLICSVEV